VALVLVLASRRRDVGVPAFGHPPPRELDITHAERRLQLEQQHRLLELKTFAISKSR